MKMAWMFLMLSCTASIGVEGLYITRIVTEPSQGPFRIGRQVLFSCQIEPSPPEPVTYQWKYVDHAYGGSATQQNFSTSYSYRYSFHHCYYYCEVLMNGSLVGSASRIIELQGFLYTDEPLVRSFNCGESLVLNVNNYSRYITSIAWYHNGTKIVSGNKYIIENTTLRINNMAENDTGKYEVKINSISYNHYNNSPDCDSYVLPLLEVLAAHAPVTFIVQKEGGAAYEPSSIVSTHYVTDDYNISTELRSASLNSSLFGSVSSNWYKNGTYISTGDSQELSLTYNNTATVIGDYVRLLWFNIYQWDSPLRGLCEGYYYYYRRFDVGLGYFILQISFWSIKHYSPPSSVVLHFGEPILTGFETTAVECNAVGGEPVEAYNLTLWRNGELLAHVNGRHLSHMTTPYQYGAYRCSVDSIHETAILMERVPFQLLLDDIYITNMECQQIQPVEDLRASVSALLETLCQSCDGIYPSSIVDVELNCSGSSMYVRAGLVYSAPDGGITVNTLINMLLTWMLSEDAPSILFQGSAVRLNKQCPTPLNAITRHGCIAIFTSEALTIETTSITVTQASGLPNFVVGFFSGLSAGVLVTTVIIVALTICLLKIRRHAAKSSVTFEADKSADIAMGTNQAYESVESRYQTGGGGCTQGGPQGEEVIYELPTV